MLNITSSELKDLETIGYGTFGRVYKKGDLAYKIYHETIVSDIGRLYVNPSIIYRKRKLNKLMSLDKKLKYTDLIKDVIFVDGKFKGVVIPYYNGCCINKLLDTNFNLKIQIAKQLIRNSKELTDNNIYSLDYKLNMYENGNVKIIDLDDIRTKVYNISSPIHKIEAIHGLDESIKVFFKEYKINNLNKESKSKLIKPKLKNNKTYEEILNYILEKEQTIKLYLLDIDNLTEEEINNIKNYNNYKVIIICHSILEHENEYYERIINYLNNKGIQIYDFIEMKEIEDYKNNNNVIDIKGRVLIKK